jgi:DNA polymerase III subunit gamma/tau
MSYLPFHHKYRPQTFADLVGQEAIAATLTSALRLSKIAPAYLFTGPRGTGKTSSARILAKSLNCTASAVPTAEPCGICGVCKSIANGSALDVIEIDAASNTGVDNIREIIERAQYAPVQCRYKVYTIDECHMLSTAAFNSLLKTLEEPPPQVVFVLATTDPQRVLPTIISRCQKFDYRRIPLEAMVGHLQYIAQQEGVNITPTALQLVAQIAQGGLRDAESLLDQLSLLDREIGPEQVWDLVGTVPERDLLEIAQAVHHQDLEGLLERCRHLLERGKEPLTILQNLTGFYRDLSIAKTAPKRFDLTTLTIETWQQALELTISLDLGSILAAQQQLKESEVQLKNSTQPRLWLEIALLGLLADAHPVASPVAVAPPAISATSKAVTSETMPAIEKIEPPAPQITQPVATPTVLPASPPETTNATVAIPAVEPAIVQSVMPEEISPVVTAPTSLPVAVPPPVPEPEPVPVAPVVPEVDLSATWQELLKQMLPSGRGLFAPYGSLLSISDDLAVIGMKNATMSKFAEGQRSQVEKLLSAILGRSIAVRIQHTNNPPAAAPVTPTPAPPVVAIDPVPSSSPPATELNEAEILSEPEEPEIPDWEPVELPRSTVAEQPLPLAFGKVVSPAAPELPPVNPAIPESSAKPESAVSPALLSNQGSVLPVAIPAADSPETEIVPDASEELEAAAARLAERFAGEVLPELAIAWDA